MSSLPKRLSVILPSFNDARIADAIRSIRRFDDIGTIRLIVVDGGSKQEVLDVIAPLVTTDDVFISEPDRGIFDALNKGLDRCATDFIGWLGSDDLFTGRILASDVVSALEQHDIYVTSLAVFQDTKVRRITHSLPSRLGLVRYGLHNPHYATFGRAVLLKSERFRLDLLGSDIDYFLRIFAKKPSVSSTNAVAVLMREGGFSSRSHRKIFDINLQLFKVYMKHTNAVIAAFALLNKMTYKLAGSLYYRIFRLDPASLLACGDV